MGIGLLDQLELLLRILTAGVCGAVIGYERENHMKMVGIRTHCIVAIASALLAVISKYGFYDLLGLDGTKFDPSRVASGIVTAIGFLGTGIILNRKQGVSGLTTSAGILATVGVGMAVGSGLYIIGGAVTILIILVHLLLHKKSRLIKDAVSEQITLELEEGESMSDMLDGVFGKADVKVMSFRAKKIAQNRTEVRLSVRYPEVYGIRDIERLFRDTKGIKSIEM